MEHLGTWMSALTVPAVQGGCTVRNKCAPLSPAPTPQRLLDSAVLNVRQTDLCSRSVVTKLLHSLSRYSSPLSDCLHVLFTVSKF